MPMIHSPQVASAPLIAACGDSENGPAEPAAAEEQAVDMADGAPADDEPDAEEEPTLDTELAVGDGFHYKDGVKITITKVGELTAADFGEYYAKPEADQTGLRLSWDIANGSKKRVDLHVLGYDAQGASTGRTTESISTENGGRTMTGWLAPGRTGKFTAEYAVAKSGGLGIVFTMSRIDEDTDILAEEPHRTDSTK
ncbi:hypothetical protein ACIRQP_02750 [Streptomyces sp. NPDC102274]|uniref:hypothetical protein n=1 Tax=Streptomyces sp. NPDC102274 TaxID=3366151 RepID=UPI00380979FE